MIDHALLTRLRETDSGAHDAWKIMHDVYSIREGSAMSDAWLQHVLQDACQAKGWQGIVLFSIDSNRAVIDGPDTGFGYRQKLTECVGNSPAEAILRAYLAAIEV